MPFLSLPSIYKPSFISIPFVLSKIWGGQTSIMKNKRLCGDNSTNMQGMIMVIGFALPLIDIYLYIKFYLNANRSFKVIC